MMGGLLERRLAAPFETKPISKVPSVGPFETASNNFDGIQGLRSQDITKSVITQLQMIEVYPVF